MVRTWQKPPDEYPSSMDIVSKAIPVVKAIALEVAHELASGETRDGDLEAMAERMRPRQTASLHDVRQPSTYARWKDENQGPSGVMFFSDVLAAAGRKDLDARDRLMRHMREEEDGPRGPYLKRATGTGNLSGLIVPSYITSDYHYAIAAGRPLADRCNIHPMPATGVSLNYPVGTAGTSAAIQASENAAVSTQTMTGSLGTATLQTAAGTIQVSRQAVDRGTGVSEIVIEDLLLRTASAVDSQLVNQASVGLNALANVFTYTSATPTGAAMLTAINTAAAGVAKGMQALGTPTFALMTEQRWLWLNSQLGTTLPLIQSPAPALPWAGTVEHPESTYLKGPMGALPSGLPVIRDPNIAVNLGAGTNQDRVYVCAGRQLHLWEAPPGPPVHVADAMPASGPLMFVSADQAQATSVAVVLTAWSYFFYAFNVYSNAVWCTDGTGQVVQTGF